MPPVAEEGTDSPDRLISDPDSAGMEAHVAGVVASVHAEFGAPSPIGEWRDVPASRVGSVPLPDAPLPPPECSGARPPPLPEGEYTIKFDLEAGSALLVDSTSGYERNASLYVHSSLLTSMATFDPDVAPLNHKEAVRLGGKWMPAEGKEMANHLRNGTWKQVPLRDLPKGRRLHKLVWVYKVKRDGTAKARLCVQGCTMVPGEDYD